MLAHLPPWMPNLLLARCKGRAQPARQTSNCCSQCQPTHSWATHQSHQPSHAVHSAAKQSSRGSVACADHVLHFLVVAMPGFWIFWHSVQQKSPSLRCMCSSLISEECFHLPSLARGHDSPHIVQAQGRGLTCTVCVTRRLAPFPDSAGCGSRLAADGWKNNTWLPNLLKQAWGTHDLTATGVPVMEHLANASSHAHRRLACFGRNWKQCIL